MDSALFRRRKKARHYTKRLILSHHKNLNQGDYLIDDRTKNGADKFEGKHLHFGTEQFANWNCVLSYLDCGPFTPSDILQDCLKNQPHLCKLKMRSKAESLVLLQIAINGKCLIWHVFMWMKQQPNTKRSI